MIHSTTGRQFSDLVLFSSDYSPDAAAGVALAAVSIIAATAASFNFFCSMFTGWWSKVLIGGGTLVMGVLGPREVGAGDLGSPDERRESSLGGSGREKAGGMTPLPHFLSSCSSLF